ncbi:hypothetical protein KSP39_PZI009709 [Platanthera zijinensis]|uniref:Uncharacterized protein n=1 Tax=Platanthera zijinensis TaxID=2320716 RepID=A0AAP0G6I4_9ASPA
MHVYRPCILAIHHHPLLLEKLKQETRKFSCMKTFVVLMLAPLFQALLESNGNMALHKSSSSLHYSSELPSALFTESACCCSRQIFNFSATWARVLQPTTSFPRFLTSPEQMFD